VRTSVLSLRGTLLASVSSASKIIEAFLRPLQRTSDGMFGDGDAHSCCSRVSR